LYTFVDYVKDATVILGITWRIRDIF